MAETIYEYSSHRSLALAERKIARLWKKYPDAIAIYIVERRNLLGEISKNGWQFKFAIEFEEEEEEPEYEGAFDSP